MVRESSRDNIPDRRRVDKGQKGPDVKEEGGVDAKVAAKEPRESEKEGKLEEAIQEELPYLSSATYMVAAAMIKKGIISLGDM